MAGLILEDRLGMLSHVGSLRGQRCSVVHHQLAPNVKSGKYELSAQRRGGDASAAGNNDGLGEVEALIVPGGARCVVLQMEGSVAVAVQTYEHGVIAMIS